MAASPSRSEVASAYHRTTYHRPDRYARSLGYLDWDTQPDPFRRFAGAALVELPLTAPGPLAELLELSLGLTAWKSFDGSRWALRANPSSGNLHGTEAYVVTAGADGVPAGVLHYAPREHGLELRCSLPSASAAELAELLGPGGSLVGLSSILWREAWKYGERSLRYIALDIGHALGALGFAAAAVGYEIEVLASWSDDDIADLLGLTEEQAFRGVDPWEHEVPEVLVRVAPSLHGCPRVPPPALLKVLAAGTWHGRANALSAEHHPWDVVFATALATRSLGWSASGGVPPKAPARRALSASVTRDELRALIRARRSAQALSAMRFVGRETFERILEATLVSPGHAPWRAGLREPNTHLVLFVHRVEGLASGLYILVRDSGAMSELTAALSPEFLWSQPELSPGSALDGRLFCLKTGDCQALARTISCSQDIAADGVFSLGMLSRFRACIEADASAYRRLFWEGGLIGQALYLAAEAEGLRGTGIGCYLDPLMHQLLGLRSDAWQVMYHFTIGEGLDDARLETLPPYAHLERCATD